MRTAEIIQLAYALLPLVKTGVQEFAGWINSLRSTLQQTGEWTPELEAQHRAALWAATQDPAYQPDAA